MSKYFVIIRIFLITLFFIFQIEFTGADIGEEILKREEQIKELERRISEYQAQISEKQKESKTLEREISTLDAQINKLKAEIRSLELAVETTNLEIEEISERIDQTIAKIEKLRKSLSTFIRLVAQADQESLLEIILKNKDISDFFGNLENIRLASKNAENTLNTLKNLKTELNQKKEELEDKKSELVQLKNIQTIQKRNLDSKKEERSELLIKTRGQEKRFQELVKLTKKDIEKIREQIQFLLLQGISLEDAIKFGQLAAIRVGIRPSFLLAILDVESQLGRKIGSGNWFDDMYQCYINLGKPSRAEEEKAAFFEITKKLGLDPNSVKVSAKPPYGCGGAMGPAQFLPTTWLLYEEEVARLVGRRPPNPWNIEDAFMAAAVKLATAGAINKNFEGESRAAKVYLSGNPNCTKRICSYYVDLVLSKAEELDKQLNS